jgi:hypothetical protein
MRFVLLYKSGKAETNDPCGSPIGLHESSSQWTLRVEAKPSFACRHFRFPSDWLPDGRLLVVPRRENVLLRS